MAPTWKNPDFIRKIKFPCDCSKIWGNICIILTVQMNLYVNKLATLVEGDPKAPFSIATTPRCRGGCYSFPWIAPLYPWSLPYNAEWCNGYRRRKWTRRHEFKSWTRLMAFHIALIPLGKVWIQLFSLRLWVNSRTDWVLQPWWGN